MPAVTVVVTVAVLAPLLVRGGYALVGDMVFVPHQPWKAAWWGGDGALPRAVPMDALVSIVTQLLPGWVLQRVLLLGAFLAGGLGIARLVRALRPDAGLAVVAAVTVYLWNPWVHDHLAMGQWAILAGYLLLPYAALAAHRVRADGVRAGAPGLVLALTAAAVCSPASGVMAVLTALVLVLPRRADTAATLAVGAIANLPWLVPSVAATGARVSTDGVFAAFAPRGESDLGVVASLLSLGGTWKTSVAALERGSAVIVGLAVLLTLTCLVGVVLARRRREDAALATVDRLAVLALLALAIALLPVLPGGAGVLDDLAGTVPGLALFRDAERYLAPAVLVLAVGAVDVVRDLLDRAVPGRGSLRAAAALVVVAPVLFLPSLAGGAGALDPVDYPPGWDAVADRLAAADAPVTVVLPWEGNYRGFAWNPEHAVLDPAPRYLPGTVVIDDRLVLQQEGRTVVVPSEDPAARAVDAALGASTPQARAAALADLGVTHVLLETPQDAAAAADQRADLPVGTDVVEADGLLLRALPPPSAAPASTERIITESSVRLRFSVGVSNALTSLLAGVMVVVTSRRAGLGRDRRRR